MVLAYWPTIIQKRLRAIGGWLSDLIGEGTIGDISIWRGSVLKKIENWTDGVVINTVNGAGLDDQLVVLKVESRQ